MADQVSAKWAMDVRREDMAQSMRGEDASQPADSTEPRSEVNVALASVEPNIVPPGGEQPVLSSVAPTADAAGSIP